MPGRSPAGRDGHVADDDGGGVAPREELALEAPRPAPRAQHPAAPPHPEGAVLGGVERAVGVARLRSAVDATTDDGASVVPAADDDLKPIRNHDL